MKKLLILLLLIVSFALEAQDNHIYLTTSNFKIFGLQYNKELPQDFVANVSFSGNFNDYNKIAFGAGYKIDKSNNFAMLSLVHSDFGRYRWEPELGVLIATQRKWLLTVGIDLLSATGKIGIGTKF